MAQIGKAELQDAFYSYGEIGEIWPSMTFLALPPPSMTFHDL